MITNARRLLLPVVLFALIGMLACGNEALPEYNVGDYREVKLKNGYTIMLSQHKYTDKPCDTISLKASILTVMKACIKTFSPKVISFNRIKKPEGSWSIRRVGGRLYYYQVNISEAVGSGGAEHAIRIYTRFGDKYVYYQGTSFEGNGPDWNLFLSLRLNNSKNISDK